MSNENVAAGMLPRTVAIFAAAMVLSFCTGTASACQSNETKTISAPATVAGYQTADLYAKVGGYISEMLVDIGDKVEKGQPLVKIDVPELAIQLLRKEQNLLLSQAEAEQAQALVVEAQAQLAGFEAMVKEAESMRDENTAKLNFQEKDCQRIEQLVGRGAIQPEMLDAAKFQLQAAKSALASAGAHIATAKARLSGAEAAVVRSEADVRAAEARIGVAEADVEYANELLKYTTITAPFKGGISKRMYDAGAFVQNAEGNSAAKPMLQIVRTDKMRIKFSLSMSNIAKLKRGDKIKFSRIDALPGKSFDGAVSRFSAGLDATTRMMNVEVDLSNEDGKLKPGYFGYIELFPSAGR